MKILIIQLSSQSERLLLKPYLTKVKELFSCCELHLLTHSISEEEQFFYQDVDHFWTLNSSDFLPKFIEGEEEVDLAALRLQRFLSSFKQQKYDKVYNLSFNAVSSYITSSLELPRENVVGVTRSLDGFLTMEDDASAYTWAQCKLGVDNRVHLSDLYSALFGVEVRAEDRICLEKKTLELPEEFILINLDKSFKHTSDIHKWSGFIRKSIDENPFSICVLGEDEEKMAQLKSLVTSSKVSFLNADRPIDEKIEILQRARVVISYDHSLVSLSSYTKTPVLLLSRNEERVWGVGPLSPMSRAILLAKGEEFPTNWLMEEVRLVLGGEVGESRSHMVAVEGTPSFLLSQEHPQNFSWNLIEAIYLDGDWPVLQTTEQEQALLNINESNEVALLQLEKFKQSPEDASVLNILDRVDEVFDSIMKLVPTLSPLILWFKVEKQRIGPGPVDDLVRATEKVHVMMRNALSHYLVMEEEVSGNLDKELQAGQQGG